MYTIREHSVSVAVEVNLGEKWKDRKTKEEVDKQNTEYMDV
jgi:hypothetical protein